jgi:replicative DNA helicase
MIDSKPITTPWKHISQVYQEGLHYMRNRQKGKIKSIETPWDRFNDAGMGGIEWNTITVIAARPAAGKTLMTSQITREAHFRNPDQDFAILDFQFEMLGRTMAMREFSAHLGKSMKYIASADKSKGPILDEEIRAAFEYCKMNENRQIYVVDKPTTIEQFKHVVKSFQKHIGKPVLVTIDHSVLFKKNATEKDKFEMLYNLGEALTELKKEIPCAFIVLSQLNREIQDKDRLKEGSAGNYIKDTDIFGADAMLQHADLVVGINRPYHLHLPFYGPEQFIMKPETLVMHFLKVRNGDPRISFFEAQFDKMRIVETEPPPRRTLIK